MKGLSWVGKTSWARSLGLHNYICGHMDFNANVFRNDVMYNVIDDIPPQYLRLKHWKELIGAQKNWQSNCKYGKPVQVAGGAPAIILCNSGPDSSYSELFKKPEHSSLRQWTHQNVVFETVLSPMFRQSGDISDSTSISV